MFSTNNSPPPRRGLPPTSALPPPHGVGVGGREPICISPVPRQWVICMKHAELLRLAICHPSLGFHFITFTEGGGSGSRENAVATPPWGLEEGPGLSTYSAQGGACSEQQDPPARPKTLGWGVALQPEPETGSPGSDSGGFPEDTWSGFAMSVCSKSPWSRRPHDGLAGGGGRGRVLLPDL